MLVSLIDLPIRLLSIIKNKNYMPKFEFLLKFMSTVYIVITFLIVNLILVFLVEEPYELYEGKEIFTHVLLPVIGVLNYILCKSNFVLSKKFIFLTQIPIIIYSIWYLIMVFILKVWSDFYSVGFWYPFSLPLFIIGLLALSIGISFILYKIKFKKNKEISKNI